MSRSTDLVRALLSGAESWHRKRIRRLTPPPSTVDGDALLARGERPVTVDQTHESVIVADAFVVKWYRAPVATRAVEQLVRLAEVGFRGSPPCHAVVYASGGVPVALVSGYLPGAEDGWNWCVRDFDADFGAPLGELAARLHLALHQPAVTTVRATAHDVGQWQTQAYAALDTALALTPGPDGAWLAGDADRIRADLALPDVVGGTLLRGHGDLHVGQVLRWSGGLAVTDFDGNPAAAERSEWQPVARDLAQLLTSLQHVAMIVARQRAGAGMPEDAGAASPTWPTTDDALARAAVLRGQLVAAYRATLGAADRPELLDERVLRAFEVEQECRELVYAARFLPRWRYAPVGVLRSWYP